MRTQIAAAHGMTSSVLEDATVLMHQRRQIETRQQALKAFRCHYVLSEDEVAALTLTSEPVDERFFVALAKAKRITKDCELLLGFENQALGLEIMEQTSKNINLGFQKLYRWIQREFKTLNLENPRIGSSIRQALRVLAEQPSLFQSCLDSFADAREHILSDAFFTALTGVSASGTEDQSVKPIELAAHDPLRYVGDMLAWMHSAAVSEREALEVLFVADGGELAKGIQAGRESELWRLVSGDDNEAPAFDAVKALNDLVDRDVTGAARILRQRVEQVIQSGEDTILAYRLANLLNFYRVTFARLLGGQSLLVESLQSLETEAMRQFRSLMRDHIAALQAEFQHHSSDLAPPDFLHDALKQLVAIMKTYDTSLASTTSRESDFEAVLTEALDPFVAGCSHMAEGLGAPDDSIFLANCLLAIKAVLARFDFTLGRINQVQAEVDKLSGALAEHQYQFFSGKSGLRSLFAALGGLGRQGEDVEKVRSLGPVQPAALLQASQDLDDFLPSALMDATENLKQLQDSGLARKVTEDAAERFCVDFEHVEDMLTRSDELTEQNSRADDGEDEGNGQPLRLVFPRTSGEIRVLLS